MKLHSVARCARALVPVLVALGASCSTKPERHAGRVMFPATWDASLVRVAHGFRWVDSSSGSVRVDPNGRFSLDVNDRAATAFLDHDGDGAIDLFDEPVTHCALRDAAWECDLSHQRVVIRHLSNVGTDEGASVSVLFENYSAKTGQPSEHTDLCDLQSGLCADPSESVFGLAPRSNVRRLSSCKVSHEWELALSAGDQVRSRKLMTPTKMEVEVQLSSSESVIIVNARTNLSVTRALVWIEAQDGSVPWNTELAPDALQIAADMTTIRIARDDFHRWGANKVHVQFVHLQEHMQTTHISEAHWSSAIEDIRHETEPQK